MAKDLRYQGEWGIQRRGADWLRETTTKEKLRGLDAVLLREWKREESGMVPGSQVWVIEENSEYQEKENLFIVKGTGLAENMKSLLSGMQPLVWQQDTHHEKSIKQVHKWEQSFRTGEKMYML